MMVKSAPACILRRQCPNCPHKLDDFHTHIAHHEQLNAPSKESQLEPRVKTPEVQSESAHSTVHGPAQPSDTQEREEVDLLASGSLSPSAKGSPETQSKKKEYEFEPVYSTLRSTTLPPRYRAPSSSSSSGSSSSSSSSAHSLARSHYSDASGVPGDITDERLRSRIAQISALMHTSNALHALHALIAPWGEASELCAEILVVIGEEQVKMHAVLGWALEDDVRSVKDVELFGGAIDREMRRCHDVFEEWLKGHGYETDGESDWETESGSKEESVKKACCDRCEKSTKREEQMGELIEDMLANLEEWKSWGSGGNKSWCSDCFDKEDQITELQNLASTMEDNIAELKKIAADLDDKVVNTEEQVDRQEHFIFQMVSNYGNYLVKASQATRKADVDMYTHAPHTMIALKDLLVLQRATRDQWADVQKHDRRNDDGLVAPPNSEAGDDEVEGSENGKQKAGDNEVERPLTPISDSLIDAKVVEELYEEFTVDTLTIEDVTDEEIDPSIERIQAQS